jgi:hypothetical protein
MEQQQLEHEPGADCSCRPPKEEMNEQPAQKRASFHREIGLVFVS